MNDEMKRIPRKKLLLVNVLILVVVLVLVVVVDHG